jgi:hypothetical protein
MISPAYDLSPIGVIITDMNFIQESVVFSPRICKGISSGATYFGHPKCPFASRGGREIDRFCPLVRLHLGVALAARRILAFASIMKFRNNKIRNSTKSYLLHLNF